MAVTTTLGLSGVGSPVRIDSSPTFVFNVAAARTTSGAIATFYNGNSGVLYGRMLDAAGQPSGAQVTIGSTDATPASATALANGNVVATWVERGIPHNVKYQIFDSSLNPVTSILSAESAAGVSDNFAPTVDTLSGGGFVLAWGSFRGGPSRVVMNRFTDAGVPVSGTLGPATVVSSGFGPDGYPSLDGLLDGGFALAWEQRGPGPYASWTAVYNANGTVRRGPLMHDNVGQFNWQTDVAGLPNGGFAVAWGDNGYGAADTDVTLARFTAGGAATGSPQRTDQYVNQHEFEPKLAANADGYLLLTETVRNQANTANSVWSTLMSPSGAIVGSHIPMVPAPSTIESAMWLDNSRAYLNWATNVGVNGQIFELRRTVIGDGASNTINLVSDNIANTVHGEGGGDFIVTAGGADQLFGGDGADIIYAGGGADYIQGDGGPSSVLVGEGGADVIYGGAGDDYMIGGDGADTLVGLGGQDSLYGGAGDDYLVAGDGIGAVVDGGAGANSLWGASGNDYMVGGEGADLIVGAAGSDYLFGNAGNDTLYGGQGVDFLYSNAGNDFIWTDDAGAPQSTDYVYAGGGTGIDTLADFTPGAGTGHDVLVVSLGSGVTNFTQLMAGAVQVSVYTVLTLGADQVYLYNVQPFQLTADDFIFL